MYIVVSKPQKIKPKFRSFTLNEEAFIDASEKQVQLLTRNPNAQFYQFVGTLSFESPLNYKQHKKQWGRVSRRIRDKGIVLFWVREIQAVQGEYNMESIHYHFVIMESSPLRSKNIATYPYNKKQIKSIIKNAMKGIKHRLYVEPIQTTIPNVCRYILKAKASGYTSKGNYSEDKHKGKRVLFPRYTGLPKIGYIGKFWGKPKKVLWAEVIAETKLKNNKKQVGESSPLHSKNITTLPIYLTFNKKQITSSTKDEKQVGKQIAFSVPVFRNLHISMGRYSRPILHSPVSFSRKGKWNKADDKIRLVKPNAPFLPECSKLRLVPLRI